jgi:hypothetical protein
VITGRSILGAVLLTACSGNDATDGSPGALAAHLNGIATFFTANVSSHYQPVSEEGCDSPDAMAFSRNRSCRL